MYAENPAPKGPLRSSFLSPGPALPRGVCLPVVRQDARAADGLQLLYTQHRCEAQQRTSAPARLVTSCGGGPSQGAQEWLRLQPHAKVPWRRSGCACAPPGCQQGRRRHALHRRDAVLVANRKALAGQLRDGDDGAGPRHAAAPPPEAAGPAARPRRQRALRDKIPCRLAVAASAEADNGGPPPPHSPPSIPQSSSGDTAGSPTLLPSSPLLLSVRSLGHPCAHTIAVPDCQGATTHPPALTRAVLPRGMHSRAVFAIAAVRLSAARARGSPPRAPTPHQHLHSGCSSHPETRRSCQCAAPRRFPTMQMQQH